MDKPQLSHLVPTAYCLLLAGIEITEVKEGILLKTGSSPITEARGFLRGKRFTTKRYMEIKKSEKDLE